MLLRDMFSAVLGRVANTIPKMGTICLVLSWGVFQPSQMPYRKGDHIFGAVMGHVATISDTICLVLLWGVLQAGQMSYQKWGPSHTILRFFPIAVIIIPSICIS